MEIKLEIVFFKVKKEGKKTARNDLSLDRFYNFFLPSTAPANM